MLPSSMQSVAIHGADPSSFSGGGLFEVDFPGSIVSPCPPLTERPSLPLTTRLFRPPTSARDRRGEMVRLTRRVMVMTIDHDHNHNHHRKWTRVVCSWALKPPLLGCQV